MKDIISKINESHQIEFRVAFNDAKDKNGKPQFFIINEAIMSKLCILGEDVEPCFEGSSVSAPNVSKTFSMDNDFKKTLFTMMQELQFALQGEQQMDNEVVITEENINVVGL